MPIVIIETLILDFLLIVMTWVNLLISFELLYNTVPSSNMGIKDKSIPPMLQINLSYIE
jgi:hypothetical protein